MHLPLRSVRREARFLKEAAMLDPSSPLSSSSSWKSLSPVSAEGMKRNEEAGGRRGGNMGCYRSQLEQEIKRLQKQLKEEIDLHVVLANVVKHNNVLSFNPSTKLPKKAQELLANIAALENAVSKLEEELVALHFRLGYERNEHRLSETHVRYLPSLPLSPEPPTSFTSSCTWEQHITSLRDSKLGGDKLPCSDQHDCSYSSENILSDKFTTKGIPGEFNISKAGRTLRDLQLDAMDMKQNFLPKKPSRKPNQLSEEMVRCMRNIFIRLSEPTTISSKASSSESVPCLSSRSLTFVSELTVVPPLMQNPYPHHNFEVIDIDYMFDPYGVNGKGNWKDIGSYTSAAEVSWMSVGKIQLEYAAEALKLFRCLVEQLENVNPALMSNSERLAFWINLYNALIMHAYLAYGVPKSDIKLFSLMQKVSYTVGGQLFSAADIEFVILKMKPPAHRPQIALILALHKFKMSEKHRKYSIDSSEPLVAFALSCGMYSSPAVRVFTADNIHEELENATRDYIRASIGISDNGKLLVPKLVHSYARVVVEDSLLVDWICRYLTPDQLSAVRDCTSTRKKQRLLSVRSLSLVSFDSRFRYLFLPDYTKSSE